MYTHTFSVFFRVVVSIFLEYLPRDPSHLQGLTQGTVPHGGAAIVWGYRLLVARRGVRVASMTRKG